ncbi:MAG: protein TonB [Candidatus Krumholzibacteriia bacterium]
MERDPPHFGRVLGDIVKGANMNNLNFDATGYSANLDFKSQYNQTLRWSAGVAVLVTGLTFWLSPRYTPQPYQLRRTEMTIQKVEIIHDIIEPPKVAPPPTLPKTIVSAPVDDPGAVDEAPFLDFDYFGPAASAPAPIDDGFVASSSNPILISQPKPYYPEVARMAQVEGLVIVKVLVDIDGSVKAAQIVKGAHILLNNAALKAARKCVFKPGQQRSLKVPTWVAVPYNFKLH